MASATQKNERIQYGEFKVEVTKNNPGLNLPQRVGKKLWLPMFLMGIMAFPVAFILGAFHGAAVADGNEVNQARVLGQLVPAVQFIGFMSIFSAIVFAIARILGAFREGGGGVQEAAGKRVLTLVMPRTAYTMLLLMMMGMMMLLFAIVAHFVLAFVVDGASDSTLRDVQTWSTWLDGLRRFGVSTYLLSFAFGLYTIVNVIRLQSRRIRELSDEEAVST